MRLIASCFGCLSTGRSCEIGFSAQQVGEGFLYDIAHFMDSIMQEFNDRLAGLQIYVLFPKAW